MPRLNDLLLEADGELAIDSNTLIILDEYWAESFKHNFVDLDENLSIVGLPGDLKLSDRQPAPSGLFCIVQGSSSQLTSLKKLLLVSNFTQCKRIVLILPPSVALFLSGENLSFKFLPFQISIVYLPLFLSPILASQRIQLQLLSSPTCRVFHQPHLAPADPYTSTVPSIADRLYPTDRLTLKLLTQELAGALHCDLSLDPTGRIFTMGPIASLVGHNLEAAVATVANNLKSTQRTDKYITSSLRMKDFTETCSLLLIDRNEDLHTALSHEPSSLASRLLATLPRRSFPRETRVTAPPTDSTRLELPELYQETDVYLDSRMDTALRVMRGRAEDESQLWRPMSGVASLRLFSRPSLLHRAFSASVMLVAEDRGCKGLCDAMTRTVEELRGEALQLPAKKRGLGAETLAVTQELLRCPQLPVSAAPLLSTATGVIEAMQRSSGKQFSQICAWRCSVDDRAARERQLDAELQPYLLLDHQAAIDACIAALISLIKTGELSSGPPKSAAKKSSKAAEDFSCVDLEHVLMMLAAKVSQLRTPPTEDLEIDLVANIAEYLLTKWYPLYATTNAAF